MAKSSIERQDFSLILNYYKSKYLLIFSILYIYNCIFCVYKTAFCKCTKLHFVYVQSCILYMYKVHFVYTNAFCICTNCILYMYKVHVVYVHCTTAFCTCTKLHLYKYKAAFCICKKLHVVYVQSCILYDLRTCMILLYFHTLEGMVKNICTIVPLNLCYQKGLTNNVLTGIISCAHGAQLNYDDLTPYTMADRL